VYLRETALAYKLDGFDVHLVVYGYGKGEDASGLTIHRCRKLPGTQKFKAGPSWTKPFLDLMMVRTLKKVIRENDIDEVDAHNYEGLMVALAAGKRPITYHAHNAMSDELPQYFGGAGWARFLGRRLDRMFPKRADSIIAPHERLKEYLIECGCWPEKIRVVPPTIDPTPFQQEKRPTDVPTLIYAGNLDRYQNLVFLMEVMKQVRTRIPTTELIVATSEDRHIHGTTTVHTPDLESLVEVICQDAVFVCPRTSWSGFPMKLLNAQAAGLPIVCCDSSAHFPIRDDENTTVVPDNDEDAFARAIIKRLT
jgi:glycosyltransferase involved in cell wall biosynthesis